MSNYFPHRSCNNTSGFSCDKVIDCLNRQWTRYVSDQSTDLVNFCTATNKCVNEQLQNYSEEQTTLLTYFDDAVTTYLKTLTGYSDTSTLVLTTIADVLQWAVGGGGGGTGTLTSVAAGVGMDFTTITTTGTVTLGTPSSVTLASTNTASGTTHTHLFAPGGTTAQYIRGNGTLATLPIVLQTPWTSNIDAAGFALQFTGDIMTDSVTSGSTLELSGGTSLIFNQTAGTYSFRGVNSGVKVDLLAASNITSSRTLSFPNASGTIALTSNIPTASFLPITGTGTATGNITGSLNGHILTILDGQTGYEIDPVLGTHEFIFPVTGGFTASNGTNLRFYATTGDDGWIMTNEAGMSFNMSVDQDGINFNDGAGEVIKLDRSDGAVSLYGDEIRFIDVSLVSASVGYVWTLAVGTGKGVWAAPVGTGTVNSGTQYRLAYYATTGTAVSEASAITASRALVSDANGVPTHSTTTTTQLQYLSSATGTTGTASTNIVFSTSPTLTTSLLTGSTTFALLNTTATTVNAFGAATTLNIGAAAATVLNFGGSTSAAEFRFLEPSASGTNYTAFKAQAQGANITYTLPAAVGAAGTTLTDAAGSGTLSWGTVVTSVGFTGGLISVATATTTPALTVAGTSGGVPYFSSTSTWASSALLAANALMIGGGAGATPATTTTGTDVLTALGVAVGSAGAFVVNGGALGTPSSGTLTSATGLPISTGVSGLGSGVATFLATPSSANLRGALTDENGTGVALFDAATTPTFTTGFQIGGAAASRKIIVGNGTNFIPSTETWAVPGTTGNLLISDGTNWTSAAASTITGVVWNNIASPTADQALTFAAGYSSTWTNSNTTEDLLTVNSSTMTTSSLFSLNSTSTALAAGNNLAEFVMSGANGSNAITATGVRISVTNTNVTSGTNVGLDVTATGATTGNVALMVTAATGSSSSRSMQVTGRAGFFGVTAPQFDVDIGNGTLATGSLYIGTAAGGTNGNMLTGSQGLLTSNVNSIFQVLSSSNINGRIFFGGTGATAVSAGLPYGTVQIGAATVVEASSGNHPLLSSLIIKAATLTGAAATVSDTATLYIEGALSGTVSGANYSIWVDAGNVKFDGNLTVLGQTSSTAQTVTYGTTTTWDWNSGTNAVVTLTGNITTFTISNAVAGTYATIRMVQDGTGSRTTVLPASSKVINGGAGAITLSTAAAAIDLLTVYYDGTTYYWNYGKNYT